MDRIEWIDQLLSRINIVQIVSRYIPLKKKGRTYWGCCPFHHEKDPSFAVNEDKQFYHCFGCKESGTAITFVQKMESISYMEAARMLADEIKMDIPRLSEDPNGSKDNWEKKERLYALMREAAKHYHDNLYASGGKIARDYLESRKIDKSMVSKFGFGASLSGREIIDYLESKGYTKTEMKEAGLVEQRADDWYDVFYKRFIIPIINNFGQVVAFGGRLITPETHVAVKYRNSSNTLIFDKSKTLYAINLLKKKKQREDINYVIIVEGYMDVIALHKAGFDTAVASMGTALTLAQAKLIRNYSNNVYISYDGDGAGQTATLRGLDILAEAGLNVKVVSLPDGLDPDDLIKERGREAYEKLLKEALTLPAFKLKVLRKKYDLTAPDEKSKYAIEAIKVIKALENPVEQEEYLKIVHKDTGYSLDALNKQADTTTITSTQSKIEQLKQSDASVKDKRTPAELFVMVSIAHGMDYVDFSDDVYTYLTRESDRKVYEYALSKYKAGEKPSVSGLYSFLSQEDATEIVGYDFLAGDNEKKYKSCLVEVKKAWLTNEIKRLSKEYDETKNVALLTETLKLSKALGALKNGGEDD